MSTMSPPYVPPTSPYPIPIVRHYAQSLLPLLYPLSMSPFNVLSCAPSLCFLLSPHVPLCSLLCPLSMSSPYVLSFVPMSTPMLPPLSPCPPLCPSLYFLFCCPLLCFPIPPHVPSYVPHVLSLCPLLCSLCPLPMFLPMFLLCFLLCPLHMSPPYVSSCIPSYVPSLCPQLCHPMTPAHVPCYVPCYVPYYVSHYDWLRLTTNQSIRNSIQPKLIYMFMHCTTTNHIAVLYRPHLHKILIFPLTSLLKFAMPPRIDEIADS